MAVFSWPYNNGLTDWPKYKWSPINDITIDQEKYQYDNRGAGSSDDDSLRVEQRDINIGDSRWNKAMSDVGTLGIKTIVQTNDAKTAYGNHFLRDFGDGLRNKANLYTLYFEDIDKLRARCCTGDIVGGFCGDYTSGSTKCQNEMSDICSRRYGDFDEMCVRKFCPTSRTCNAVGTTTGWCMGNMDDPRCQKFCLQAGVNCDDAVLDYCAPGSAAESSDFCGCIYDVRNTTDPKVRTSAACVGLKCSNLERNAYKMKSWNQDKGCQVVDCSQVLNVKGSGDIDISDVKFEQNCGSGPIGSAGEPTDGDPDKKEEEDGLSPLAIFGIVMLILFVMVAIILGAYFALKDDDPPMYMTGPNMQY